MSKAVYKVVVSIVSSVIFMLSFSLAITLFNVSEQFNKVLIDANNHKASSRYSLDYAKDHIYISPSDAFEDILEEDISVAIRIDGVDLNPDVLSKARYKEPTAINALKSALTHTKYRKVLTVNQDGILTMVDFYGED